MVNRNFQHPINPTRATYLNQSFFSSYHARKSLQQSMEIAHCQKAVVRSKPDR